MLFLFFVCFALRVLEEKDEKIRDLHIKYGKYKKDKLTKKLLSDLIEESSDFLLLLTIYYSLVTFYFRKYCYLHIYLRFNTVTFLSR
jgi:hypothetical protein